MSSFTKKTLIALLVLSSGSVSALELSDQARSGILPTLPPLLTQHFSVNDIEILSSKPKVKTLLSFVNKGDFTVNVKIEYKHKDPETMTYSDMTKEFEVGKGFAYTVEKNGDDAFVKISSSLSNEDKTRSKRFSIIKLCSFNNKFFSTNQVPQENRKTIEFMGSENIPSVVFPDLSNQGYASVDLEDTQCWEVPSPDNIIIYEHSFERGLSKSISNSTPDLGKFNNKMSSYLIPRGWNVTFYEQPNYSGSKYIRTESSEFDSALNDKIKSIKINSKGQ